MNETTSFRIDPSRNPILANLPDRAASALIAQGVRKNHAAGATLVREGDPSSFLMFVIAGEVAIFKGDIEIDRQPAGGVLGEMGALTGQPRTATVKCVTDVVLWEVQTQDFLAMLEGYPSALRSLVRALVEKFEATQTPRAQQTSHLQRATDILSRCVSPEVLDGVLKRRTPAELLEGSIEEAGILFIDIKGFSAVAEQTPVRELLSALNDHLAIIVDSVARHGGTIVNFIGDAVLAVFNTPAPLDRPSVAAVNCFLHCLYELREMQAKRKTEGAICFELGAGINFGSVIAGAIGSHARFSYSVLGDEVNLTARLEGLTRKYPVDLVLSEACFNRLSIELAERCLLFDRVRVKGRTTPLNLYTLTEMMREARQPYAQGLKLYSSGQFAEAAKVFGNVNHPLAGYMAERCTRLASSPPVDWDGAYVWDTK